MPGNMVTLMAEDKEWRRCSLLVLSGDAASGCRQVSVCLHGVSMCVCLRCPRVSVCASICVCLRAGVYLCVSIMSVYVCVYVICVCVRISVSSCVYMYICLCICLCAYVCI